MNVSAETADWHGAVAFAPMLALFCGNGGQTSKHQTVAHKVIVGLQEIQLDGAPSAVASSVVVPAGTAHQFDARARNVIVAFLDMRHYSLRDAHDLAQKWNRIDPDSVSIDCLREDVEATLPRTLAPRILKAVSALEEFPTIRQAANSIGLSEGRFTHLISEQLGAPPQRWRRWLRLRRAIDLVADGQNVTTAAHDAGFADSAHFSRTCAEALGLRPSVLKSRHTRFIRSDEACDVASI